MSSIRLASCEKKHRSMPVGTVLTVGDIPELRSEKIDLQVDPEEIVLRISDGRHTAQTDEQIPEV